MGRKIHQQNIVKRYLLQQLSEAEQQEIELRLLSEDDLSKELEIAEDELIDEYLANELSQADRTSFEQHFLTTPERNSNLRSAQALKRYFVRFPSADSHKPGRWAQLLERLRGSHFPTPIMAPVALLVVAVVGLVLWRTAVYKSDLDKGLIALNNAYAQERPIEARISMLDYAPFVAARGNEPEQTNTLELDRAQRLLLDAEKENPGGASHHALGKLYLLQKQPDKAIGYLENAIKADPKNAQIYADLGAAYLEKGKLELETSKPDLGSANAGKGLGDLGRSLEFLQQALELNPNLLEALFNRALVHQHQDLYQEAQANWRAYLEKDASSQWAVEARQNLKLLEEKTRTSQKNSEVFDTFMSAYRARDDTAAWEVYRRSHSYKGNEITKALIDRFLTDGSSANSTESLQALDYLGQVETSKVTDTYTATLAKVYASATPRTKPLLIQARQQVVKGYELFSESKIVEATELFTAARSTFQRLGNLPETLATDAALANAAALQPDLAKGQELLTPLIRTCESQHYRWLLAQVLTQRAHIQSNLNNYSEALSDAHRALQIFREVQDMSGALSNSIQLASLHLFLNDNETSFSFLRTAMVMAEQERASPAQWWGIHIAISLNLSALKLYRAALDYQHEALQLVMPTGSPIYISRSQQYLGLTYGALRQFDLALENVQRAYDQGMARGAERIGQNIMAKAAIGLADLYRLSGDTQRALVAYDESTKLYQGLDFAHYNYAAHKGKFLSYLAQKNDALASAELLIVLRLFDEYREKILEERQKNFFFDREQDTYDLAIDFAYSRLGDGILAFDYSETSRARSLLELMRQAAESAVPLTTSAIQQQMPEQVQIIQYAVLESKLLIWLVTRSKVVTKSVDVESSSLAEMVATTVKQIRTRDENAARVSLKKLYGLLVEPIAGEVDPNLVLCFVPDKSLHYLPFSALVSGSARYLAQDYRVMIAPSATILIESTHKARTRPLDQEEQLLAVGNPAFDRSTNPNLSDLKEAEREVEQIAKQYRVRNVLPGTQATRKSITAGLATAQVAHFAGHYVIDPRSNLSSKLLLAPEPGEQNQAPGLDSGDIYQMDLARTKLVVLAACQTGIEQQLSGEGPIGFARSFLVAGVPVVVASLWPVDSAATAELMILFHRFRKLGRLSITEALRHAQQEIMNREDYNRSYYWAAFTVIGGYSEY